MKSSGAKKASITLPSELEKALKRLAQKEHRTLSGVIQEATRYYMNVRRFEAIQSELAIKALQKGVKSEDDVEKLIHELRASK
ncbi:MAG: hypothetical protein A3F16_08835 [Deltaproteobacteria bacterium RIFCSPHIGHO2_12_FULL_43_9]|nr:MAG: hypothetical protein A3F16_08835 [Deltaproteobacteria bacterium RIFCSPHIGHO2_12_FULL_43_9]